MSVFSVLPVLQMKLTSIQSQQTQTTQWTNQNSKRKREPVTKRGKTCVNQVTIDFGSAPDWLKKKTRLLWLDVAHLHERFLTSYGLSKRNQTKHVIYPHLIETCAPLQLTLIFFREALTSSFIGTTYYIDSWLLRSRIEWYSYKR